MRVLESIQKINKITYISKEKGGRTSKETPNMTSSMEEGSSFAMWFNGVVLFWQTQSRFLTRGWPY